MHVNNSKHNLCLLWTLYPLVMRLHMYPALSWMHSTLIKFTESHPPPGDVRLESHGANMQCHTQVRIQSASWQTCCG
ncbi:hypothetical protein JB92DRAFT_2868820 [Gautieria morchelliformis]|nr:hypothetical protein JB92DRAFT_2868820 [Gautieria morchelliformis]